MALRPYDTRWDPPYEVILSRLEDEAYLDRRCSTTFCPQTLSTFPQARPKRGKSTVSVRITREPLQGCRDLPDEIGDGNLSILHLICREQLSLFQSDDREIRMPFVGEEQ